MPGKISSNKKKAPSISKFVIANDKKKQRCIKRNMANKTKIISSKNKHDTYAKSHCFRQMIGIEIEVTGHDKRHMHHHLLNLGWNVSSSDHVVLIREDSTFYVRIKTDHSINQPGCELCVGPMKSSQQSMLHALLHDLVAIQSNVDDSCGLHVHVDAHDMTADSMGRLLTLWSMYQPRIYEEFAVMHRRAIEYAKPLSDVEIRQLHEHMCSPKCLPSYRNYAQFTRFRSLNFCRLSSYGTLEFRFFNGTLDWSSILDAIDLAAGIVWAARAGVNVPEPPHGTRMVDMLRSMFDPRLPYDESVLLDDESSDDDKVFKELLMGKSQRGVGEETDRLAHQVSEAFHILVNIALDWPLANFSHANGHLDPDRLLRHLEHKGSEFVAIIRKGLHRAQLKTANTGSIRGVMVAGDEVHTETGEVSMVLWSVAIRNLLDNLILYMTDSPRIQGTRDPVDRNYVVTQIKAHDDLAIKANHRRDIMKQLIKDAHACGKCHNMDEAWDVVLDHIDAHVTNGPQV